MTIIIRNTRPTLITIACGAVLALGAASVSTAGPALMGDQAAVESQQPVSDTWITTKVKAELATTDNVKSMDVSVDTVNGVVHLTGNVHSDIERNKAVAAAKSVKGVKQVDASGLMASANPAPVGDQEATNSQQPVSDTWITTKVKAELATTDNVSSTDVTVKTVNGVVHLTGNIHSDIERKKIVAAARSVKGVSKVDTSGLKTTN